MQQRRGCAAERELPSVSSVMRVALVARIVVSGDRDRAADGCFPVGLNKRCRAFLFDTCPLQKILPEQCWDYKSAMCLQHFGRISAAFGRAATSHERL
jgi:hypothetical protein